MSKKTILLCISTNLGISRLLERNLIACGFNVILLCPYNEKGEGFKYPTLWDRIKVNFRKNILKEKEAKRKFECEVYFRNLQGKINQKIDYSLFFLMQGFSPEIILKIKEITKDNGMINYQWDGLTRYPKAMENLKYFDRCYVFDSNDLKYNELLYNLYPTTNFYFDYEDEIQIQDNGKLYFIGGHNTSRQNEIVNFALYAQEHKINLDIQIVCQDIHKCRDIYPSNVNLLPLSEIKPFSENIALAKQCHCILDFVIAQHSGCSFRVFEALGYGKKLITTNKNIKYYDFYHPNNMFVLDNNFDELEAFLTKPYVELDPSIKKKYSFSNWINYVLNIEPYQPILLPNEN
ncbi:hypothetical protein V5G99_08355 [Bibersteinia trehalosi]|uniref:hypothetical protein n=1 Tax=Bibersteinia trehalosi TaxID=47735 RepID=UPI003D2851CE